MFYNNFDNIHGEDPWGMVGKVGDDFREDRQLNLKCYQCHQAPLIICERNWMDTNNDNSQRYQIVVRCLNCGAVDQFIVNDGQEGKNSKLRHGHQRPKETDLRKSVN